jgi:hypothetical protein
VFGIAQPLERVTITGLPSAAVVTPSNPFTASADGNWSITLAAPDSNIGVNLTFVGASGATAVLRNVLFGVTVLCSGQSNVSGGVCATLLRYAALHPHSLSLAGALSSHTHTIANLFAKQMDMCIDNCFYANETVAASGAHPDIRYKHGPSGAWTVTGSDDKGLRAFSAVCFYTAWHMKESLPALANVPIGIVQSSVGGTTIESWMSAEALAASGAVGAPTSCGFKGGCGGQAYCGNYNPLILPLAPFVFKTMLWYQGESNSACNVEKNTTNYYAKLLPALVSSWRALFGSPFTALVVALAPTGGTDETSSSRSSDGWPVLRDAQRAAVLGVKNAGLVWPIDLGDDGKTVYTPPSSRHGDLHPRNKTAFGRRLALAYGELEGVLPPAQLASGPMPASVALEPGSASVLLTFDASAPGNEGLALAPTTDCFTWGRIPAPGNSSAHCCQNNATDPKSPHGYPFEVEGALGWALAQAEVVAPTQVRLAVARCPHCAAAGALTGRVRYAWDAWPLCTLANAQGFPMAPFCSAQGAPLSAAPCHG